MFLIRSLRSLTKFAYTISSTTGGCRHRDGEMIATSVKSAPVL